MDKELCIGYEAYVSDCPVLILTMEEDTPKVITDRASMCLNCLHCLTICPTGAVSVSGFDPDDCLEIKNMLPEADKMEALLRGRRSVRNYQNDNVEHALLERLLQVAWQTSSGIPSYSPDETGSYKQSLFSINLKNS